MGTPELISPRSPRVTAARRLAKRAFRGKERRFIAEGPQAVREAVAHRGAGGEPTLVELFATVEAAERYAGHRRRRPRRRRPGAPRLRRGARRGLADRHPAGPRRRLPLPGLAVRGDPRGPAQARRRPRARTRPRQRRHGAALRGRRRAPTPSSSPTPPWTSTTPSPYGPRSAASSICRSPSASPSSRPSQGLRDAGVRVLAADGAGERRPRRRARRGHHGRPHRLDLRQRGLGPAGGDPRARRRGRARPDPRQGREPEPRDRRRRMPLCLGARPARTRRVPLRDQRVLRSGGPLASRPS